MIFFIFLFGLLIGSFLNALIWRLHTGESILHGRSYCPHCRHQLSWKELVPIASFFVQKGKCVHCNKKISWQYPVVELATGLLFALAYCVIARQVNGGIPAPIFLPENFTLAGYAVLLRNFFFIAILTVIFIYDLKWQLILDRVTLPAIALAFIGNVFLGISWYTMFVGAIIAGGFFLLQFIISKGRWIGGGDIRLGVLIGVLLGWKSTIVALMLAYVLGSIFGIGLMMLHKKSRNDALPFGTFLSIGAFIALLWGSQIVPWYLGILGM